MYRIHKGEESGPESPAKCSSLEGTVAMTMEENHEDCVNGRIPLSGSEKEGMEHRNGEIHIVSESEKGLHEGTEKTSGTIPVLESDAVGFKENGNIGGEKQSVFTRVDDQDLGDAEKINKRGLKKNGHVVENNVVNTGKDEQDGGDAEERRHFINEGVEGGGGGGGDHHADFVNDLDEHVPRNKVCFCFSRWDFSFKEFWNEVKIIVVLALPNVAYMLLEALMTIIAVLFSGHLEKNELAAASFANSITTVFTRSIGLGFASSCDTLFSQFYGSSHRDRIGVILQRGLLIMALLCFICWGILINTETILLLARQNSDVARLAGMYCLIYIPAVPADYCSMLLIKYLQCQSRLLPVVATTALTNAISVPIYYVLVYTLDLRLLGAAVAQVIAHYILCFLIIGYIIWRKLYKETWKGWSKDSLTEWKPIVKLGVAGCLMVCLEWWSFDVGYYLAGLLGEEQIGAHAIIMYTVTTGDMISYGLGTAASIRVGNSLGGKRPRTAHIASIASLSLAVVTASFLATLYAGLKDVIPYFFTSESETIEIASSILPVCAMFSLLDTTSSVCSGVIRGTGRQEVGAVVNLLGYYLVGLPLAISLMFPVNRGVHGFWSGMTLGLFVQAVFLVSFTLKLNWRKEAKKAQKRIGMHKSEGTVGLDALSDIHSMCDSHACIEDIEGELLGSDYDYGDNASSSTLSMAGSNENNANGGGEYLCTNKSTQTTLTSTDTGLRTIKSHGYVAVHSNASERETRFVGNGRDVTCNGRSLSGVEAKEAEAMKDVVHYGTIFDYARGQIIYLYLALIYVAAASVCYALVIPSLRIAACQRESQYNITTTLTNALLTTVQT